ncbi:hypothetical protein CEXT_82251 [Caerostris extrusa]|uniref:Uncharacterized protein n=1 Tax=Caerostris extrusa TaxID=172846 RepID=A0AAV4TR21_CAEEX|nr:hypothetical protein CEXT_82251 [Caerostris extrusa]
MLLCLSGKTLKSLRECCFGLTRVMEISRRSPAHLSSLATLFAECMCHSMLANIDLSKPCEFPRLHALTNERPAHFLGSSRTCPFRFFSALAPHFSQDRTLGHN